MGCRFNSCHQLQKVLRYTAEKRRVSWGFCFLGKGAQDCSIKKKSAIILISLKLYTKGWVCYEYKRIGKNLLDEMPDSDLIYLVAYMQSLKALKDAEIPNAKTQAAIDEVDSMIRTGKGEHFEALLRLLRSTGGGG